MDAPILAVDGTGLLVRCSRAARQRVLTSPDGTPTGALTLFIGSLALKVRTLQPSHLVVAWDGPNATRWRRAQWFGYKRSRLDPWLRSAELHACLEFCQQAGIYVLWHEGFEADDVLAAITRAAMNMPGKPVIIASDDADTHQLADDSLDHPVIIEALGAMPGRTTAQDVRARWGVTPMWLPKLRALSGDPSDGIPGLPGVGPAKALRMLRQGRMAWPLDETVINDPEQRRLAVIWRDIMDLVIPVRPMESVTGAAMFHPFRELARWDPQNSQNALNLLEHHGMAHIAKRLAGGRLW